MNFYQISSEKAKELSTTEKNILDYVVKNLNRVSTMSIRQLAGNCFVSTTTVFRFVKKLGFDGYNDFIDSLQETEKKSRDSHIPTITKESGYRESYLRNIMESIQVIQEDKSERFNHIMSRYPQIFILATDLSRDVAKYMYQVLTIYGYRVELPLEEYEVKSVIRRIKKDDVVFALSFSGDNKLVIRYLEEIFAISTPIIISFTRADNNVIQNMSDLNFYTFADEMSINGTDITSRCGMLAVFEVLMYQTIASKNDGNE